MNPDRRILVLTNRYPVTPGSYRGWYVKEHVELLRKIGWNSTVIAPPQTDAYFVWRYLLMFARVVQTIARTQFDLVHAHWILPSGLFGLLCARILGRPLVLTSHGAFVRDFTARSPLQRRIIRTVLRSADCVVAVGSEHLGAIETIASDLRGLTREIPVGVLIEANPGRAVPATRHQYGVPPKAFLVVFVGNLDYRKGADILLEACRVLVSRSVEFELRLAGDGPEAAALHSLCAQAGLDDKRVFVGALEHSEAIELLSSADVVVVPSRDEPFGLVAAEAMAAGRPVIASDVGGLHHQIHHLQNGILVSPEVPLEIGDWILRLKNSDTLRESLGRNAAAAASHYDMKYQVQQVAEIYDRLIADRFDPANRPTKG